MSARRTRRSSTSATACSWRPACCGPHSDVLQILHAEQPDLIEVCDKYSLFYLAGAIRKGWIRMKRRPVLVGLSCERMDDNVASYMGLGAMGRDALLALHAAHLSAAVRLPSRQLALHGRRAHESGARSIRARSACCRWVSTSIDLARIADRRRAARRCSSVSAGRESSRLLVYAGRLSIGEERRAAAARASGAVVRAPRLSPDDCGGRAAR